MFFNAHGRKIRGLQDKNVQNYIFLPLKMKIFLAHLQCLSFHVITGSFSLSKLLNITEFG